jgi:hypothetical protein
MTRAWPNFRAPGRIAAHARPKAASIRFPSASSISLARVGATRNSKTEHLLTGQRDLRALNWAIRVRLALRKIPARRALAVSARARGGGKKYHIGILRTPKKSASLAKPNAPVPEFDAPGRERADDGGERLALRLRLALLKFADGPAMDS